MARITGYAVGSVAAIVAALGIADVLGLFDELGLDRHGAIALMLGILFTALLGIGLMGLIFFGDRNS